MKEYNFSRANARFWSKLITFFTLSIGYLMAGFTNKKQALHDKIADTYVVNRNILELDHNRMILQAAPNTTAGQDFGRKMSYD
ncbi:RDD family protein [Paenibacillus thiaminolyticus]|uniref:RDD family protein n=1 Tax=Paenibacillus thiaminolyticus TaxID=49283 RepID=UPI0013F5BF01|nr:RDD family protein [Paenibacillus thiaminolyticus]NGP62174.1 hypothetical protein [Paenibacillus thiaminolyticus]WCR29445.1 RDD family protein [Paenibacillus thiaminolyticus]